MAHVIRAITTFEPVALTVHGVSCSKKTGARIIFAKGRAIPIPAKKYVSYEASAVAELATQYRREPIATPCHIVARFYRDNRADVDNLAGGLLDILQKAKVIKNDGLVYALSVSKSGRCDGDPRVEVFIAPHPGAA